MLLLGNSLAGGSSSMLPTPTVSGKFSSITLMNAEFDDLYVTQNTEGEFDCTGLPSLWDYDTIIWAKFNGNLISGNISDDMANAEFLRIKRRKKNTFGWITLFEVDPRTDPEGWAFTRYDRTARSLQDYDYAVVPVAGGIEGNLNIVPVFSCFEGIYIFEGGDDGVFYCSHAEYDNPIQRHKPATVIPTLGRAMPFTVSNGLSEYDTGTVTGVFTPMEWAGGDIDLDENALYRSEMMRFLTDGREKLIKMGNGRIWLAQLASGDVVEDPITTTSRGDISKVSFDWAENADAEKGHDLYLHDFIECDIDDITVS